MAFGDFGDVGACLCVLGDLGLFALRVEPGIFARAGVSSSRSDSNADSDGSKSAGRGDVVPP